MLAFVALELCILCVWRTGLVTCVALLAFEALELCVLRAWGKGTAGGAELLVIGFL